MILNNVKFFLCGLYALSRYSLLIPCLPAAR